MQHKNNFDGIRLLAAFAVLLSHQFWLVGRSQPTTIGPMTLGGTAVLVFFSISGYLVASSWQADPTLWRFAARRMLRIWPAYAVVILVTAVWLAVADERAIAPFASWVYAYKNLAFVQFDWTFFPTHRDARLNGSLWTIPYEVACYGVFALVALVLRRFWPPVLAAGGMAALAWWGFGKAAADPSAMSGASVAILFGAYFLVGAALLGLPALRTPKATGVIVLIGLCAFFTGSEIIGLLLVIPALTIFAGSRSWPGLRSAAVLGDLSYGIYLWGWPVQQEVVSRLGADANFAGLLATSLVLVTLMAALSWHVVEKWALGAKPTKQTAWPERLKLQRA